MNHKDFTTYTDERIINIIHQNYLYSDEHVKEASHIALERNLVQEEQLKQMLIEGSQKKAQRQEQNFRNLQDAHLGRSDAAEARSKTILFISLFLFAIGLVVFIFTGWIIFVFIGAGAAGATSFGNRMFGR